jgi:hypothetical protein
MGLAGALAVALLAAHGASPLRSGAGGTLSPVAGTPNSFSRLAPRPAPSGWPSTTLSSGAATLFYPPGWRPVPGDTGTVSVALRSPSGVYLGYLNVTPREGAERLKGWAAFRTARNRGEGDRDVEPIAAAEGLRLAGASGSCVIDDYTSRVGSHRYRELACILAGHRFTNVFVGATPRAEWPVFGPVIERAASSLLER